METLIAKLKRRPVRIAELILAAAAAVGVTVSDDVAQAVTVLVVAAVGVLAGEVAQTQTTPIHDPDLDDGHGNMADEIPEIEDGI